MWVLEMETLPVLMIENLCGLVHTSIMVKGRNNSLLRDMYVVWGCIMVVVSFLNNVWLDWHSRFHFLMAPRKGSIVSSSGSKIRDVMET
jgi:hypothetical protein